jgi:hypothetical protein
MMLDHYQQTKNVLVSYSTKALGFFYVVEGNLILKDSWPGQMRSIYRDHQRFIDTYFKIL